MTSISAACVGAIAFVLIVALSSGCAAPPAPPIQTVDAAERRRLEAAGFEVPQSVATDSLVAEPRLTGPGYQLGERVHADERRHVYTIVGDRETFYAWGDDMLEPRLHEAAVLSAMLEMQTSESFVAASERARANPVAARWSLVDQPDPGPRGAPAAAFEAAAQPGGEALAAELAAFEAKKRFVAGELGVDPYSSNPALQRELNRLVWNVYAGGQTSMLAPVSRESAGAKDRLHEILREYSRVELERFNRIELRVMGTPTALIDAFINDTAYSPRLSTILIGDLSALSQASDRSAFIEAAVNADTEPDARFYQRSAELLRRYDIASAPIERIVAIGSTPAGLTAQATLVVPYPADVIVWSEATAALAAAITRERPADIEAERLELLLSGSASETALRNLSDLGVTVIEHAFQTLTPRPANLAPAHE
jgi:hypothetical protein